jgi:AcrR family transcriptional regulator
MTTDQPTARRAYQSARRRQQAADTRKAVVDAATRLFGERGWAATGMRDVAREAGVSVETVYANFSSKGDLLMAAIDVAVVGAPSTGCSTTATEARRAWTGACSGPTGRR